MNFDGTVSELLDFSDYESFPKYLAAIDRMNECFFGEFTERHGETAAKLMFLRISNALVAKYEYKHGHLAVLSRPLSLYVDPSNACPLSCPGCVHMKEPDGKQYIWPKGLLRPNNFGRFIDDFGPYAFRIMFCNFGEPLLNKHTPSFIQRARQFGISTALSTSFSVPGIDMDALVASGLWYMILSIDGASQENYEKYRKGGNLDVVLENIQRLVSTKRAMGAYSPFSVWQFLVFEHNQKEIDTAKEMAEKLGLNAISICRPNAVNQFDPSVLVPEHVPVEYLSFQYDGDRQIADQEACLGDLDAEVIDHHFRRSWVQRFEEDIDGGAYEPVATETRCEWLYKSMVMDSGGRIFPCCISAPSDRRRLEFSTLENQNPFNDSLFKVSRALFSNPDQYRELVDKIPPPDRGPREPFCVKCPVIPDQRDLHRDNLMQRMKESSLFEAITDDTCTNLFSWNRV